MAFSMYTASNECLYGLYVINIIKAMWCADTESSAFRVYAPYVSWVLYESLHLIGASSWHIFALLHHFTSLRRHNFRLDFSARELGGLALRDRGEWLQSIPPQQHLALLSPVSRSSPGRPNFSEAVEALRSALANALAEADANGGLRMAYVTMVYGRMNRYIKGWSERLKTLGVTNLVMATLDDEAYSLCSTFHGSQCIRGSISVLNKYTILLIALQLGIDVMWLDFDIFLVRNPGQAIAKATEGYDLLMGYDFDSDCLCNGFFFIRARPETHRWLFELLRWLYDNPYEHDQRAISAFLNYTEKISAKAEDLPPVPRWHVFDVDNTFINIGSWLGNYEELQLVHFVDGSAFSLYGRESWDASVTEVKKKRLEAESKGLAASLKSDESAMDLFYRDEVASLPPDKLWDEAPYLRQRLDATKKPRPVKRQKCSILPNIATAHPGYGWLTEFGARATPPWAQ
eukprot:TRINITY_DN112119_c0_g1_i1.p1 TRINITY_DN112119_c0_g1~~TRINITY_DN112119_c0_g1_i1.p1  ORF type:complete len:478 (-),score=60.81 TRINITY_DN112119_c0_g1_i1:240-1616(-)